MAALGKARKAGGRFTLLFHDTHHRAVSDPEAMRAFDLEGYDGVLAFGEGAQVVGRPDALGLRRDVDCWVHRHGGDERLAGSVGSAEHVRMMTRR